MYLLLSLKLLLEIWLWWFELLLESLTWLEIVEMQLEFILKLLLLLLLLFWASEIFIIKVIIIIIIIVVIIIIIIIIINRIIIVIEGCYLLCLLMLFNWFNNETTKLSLFLNSSFMKRSCSWWNSSVSGFPQNTSTYIDTDQCKKYITSLSTMSLQLALSNSVNSDVVCLINSSQLELFCIFWWWIEKVRSFPCNWSKVDS